MPDRIYNIFPKPVMVCEKTYRMDAQERLYINGLKKAPNFGGGKNFKSHSSYILEDVKVSKFRDFIQGQIENYAYNHLQVESSTEFYITQSWVNYNNKGEKHHRHLHPNSIISGVYYVQGSKSPINFHSNDKNVFPIKLNFEKYKIENSTSYWIDMEPHKLFLFPSSLEHSVDTNDSDVTRISISFNTFVKGTFGTELGLDKLELGRIWK